MRRAVLALGTVGLLASANCAAGEGLGQGVHRLDRQAAGLAEDARHGRAAGLRAGGDLGLPRGARRARLAAGLVGARAAQTAAAGLSRPGHQAAPGVGGAGAAFRSLTPAVRSI